MATPPDQRRAPSRPPQAPLSGPPRSPVPRRKPASPLLQQRAIAALLLGLISLIGVLMVGGNVRRGMVVLAVTLVIGGAGLWLSVTAASRARKAGTARPRLAVLATVLGIAGTGLSALALMGFALFWTQISQYAQCMAGANTVIAQDACKQQLNDSLPGSIHMPGG